MNLDSIFDFTNGKAWNKNDKGIYPVYGSTGIIDYYSDYLFNGNKTLIARVGQNCGFTQYVDNKYWVTDNTIVATAKEHLIIPKFGYYLLSSLNLQRYKIGAAQPLLTIGILKSINVNIPSIKTQQHIVNTIGSVDDLIENYNKRINKICDILSKSLEKYQDTTSISYYEPTIIKSGINSFDIEKIYLDTSSIEGVNKISSGEIITIDHRPSRANMQPIANTVWFAKMKGSNKNLIITKNDKDIINGHILSTGFMGIEASKNLPLSLLSAFVISNNFNIQRDLNSVGTTMAGINNETFKEITVPLLNNQEVEEFDKRYSKYIDELSLLRRKIKKLEKVKELLLNKYF